MHALCGCLRGTISADQFFSPAPTLSSTPALLCAAHEWHLNHPRQPSEGLCSVIYAQ